MAAQPSDPLAPKAPHFKPKAKRVIYLFMSGAPSHIDLFDPKPSTAGPTPLVSSLTMAMAAFSGLVAQSGKANAFLLTNRSPNVLVGQLIAGGGMTAVYFTQICHHNFHHCARFDSPKALKWYGITTVGCMALTPIVAGLLVSANERRELKSSEALGIAADCVLPIIGGWIMQAAFDAHPEWDAGTGRRRP